MRRHLYRRWGCFAAAAVTVVMVGILYVSLTEEGKSASASDGRRVAAWLNNTGNGEDAGPAEPPVYGADQSWKLILVNRWHPVPDGYENQLEWVNLKYDQQIDARVYPELQQMMDDCRKAGLHPIVCSGYRSKEKQQILFDEKCNEYLQQGYSRAKAYRAAEEWVALPGTSEHHLGMAVDIVAESYQFLDRRQEETAEQQWMMAHSWEYGFILRYPTGKSSLTGIQYEPWHYRYVGRAAAAYITQNHLCLEEYLSIIMPAG